MEVLCFDIGSGGITGARFDEQLHVSSLKEASWEIHRDAHGRATLSAESIEAAFLEVASGLAGESPAAVCIGSFMHSFLILSSCCAPLTPVFTWLDTSAPEGIEAVRSRLGDR